jgi:uncharacterized protein YkwD
MPEIATVNTREFREDLSHFLDSDQTIAITKHGHVVGYYVPARDSNKIKAQVQAFQTSAERLQAVLDAQGFTEKDLEEVVAEFNVVRKKARVAKK